MYIDIALLLETASLLASIVIAVALVLLVRFKCRELELRKREYSANFVKDWNNPDLIESVRNVLFASENWDHLSAHDYQRLYSDDQATYFRVIKLLNFFEEMAQSIEYGLSEEEYLRRYFSPTARHTYLTFRPFIDMQRERMRTTQLFIAFEKLMYRWDRQYKNDELLPLLKREGRHEWCSACPVKCRR